MQIHFTDQELRVIERIAPGKTAEETVNIVLRDWFNANRDRIFKNEVITDSQKNDSILAVNSAEIKAKEGL